MDSGIQEASGGVARYYRAELQRNLPISTEITGYAARTFFYLYTLTGESRYFERGLSAARFLARAAWKPEWQTVPFELDGSGNLQTYFFDCGIIVRGLLSAWRGAGEPEFLEVAGALGRSMAIDFRSNDSEFHPILWLPSKQPADRDHGRWSQSPGCYQLKAAMAWQELAEATGDSEFEEMYHRAAVRALRTYNSFLPGHPDPARVVDRLHPFLYFLEGLLPRAADPRFAAAICDGIHKAAEYLRELAPQFERSDVYAQLLRMRIYACAAGAVSLDEEQARFEARKLEEFQAFSEDGRIDGGFYFGRQGAEWLPHPNPVSTAFALQALALWEQRQRGDAPPHWNSLI
jgi:hypothetical protein